MIKYYWTIFLMWYYVKRIKFCYWRKHGVWPKHTTRQIADGFVLSKIAQDRTKGIEPNGNVLYHLKRTYGHLPLKEYE